MFGDLALIDFAFALVSRERVTTPLPIGWQKDYDYQSPRLLRALEDGRNDDLRRTRELDWRCDIYSLAAMLKRYLPEEAAVHQPERSAGWTSERYEAAKSLLLTLRDWHDRDAPQLRPHDELIAATGARLRESDLARSLASGWTLAQDANVTPAGASPLTPMTRLAAPIRVFVSPRAVAVTRSGRASRRADGRPGLRCSSPTRGDVPRQVRRTGVRRAALASAAMVAIGAPARRCSSRMPCPQLESARSLVDAARAARRSRVAAGESARSGAAPAEEATAQQATEPPSSPVAGFAEEPAAVASDAMPDTRPGKEESASPIVEASAGRERGTRPGCGGGAASSRSRTRSAAPATKPKAAASRSTRPTRQAGAADCDAAAGCAIPEGDGATRAPRQIAAGRRESIGGAGTRPPGDDQRCARGRRCDTGIGARPPCRNAIGPGSGGTRGALRTLHLTVGVPAAGTAGVDSGSAAGIGSASSTPAPVSPPPSTVTAPEETKAVPAARESSPAAAADAVASRPKRSARRETRGSRTAHLALPACPANAGTYRGTAPEGCGPA